jgi:hypothetical protein
MKRNMVALVITVVFLASTALANTVIDTYPDWTGDFTGGWTAMTQTFTVPTDNVLVSFMFGIEPRSWDGNLTFSIYNWDGWRPVGTALFSVTLPWTASTNDILVPGINLALTTGNLYGAVIDLQGCDLNSVHYESNYYTGGNGFWTHDITTWPNDDTSDLGLQFRAEFETAGPVPILIDIKPGGYPNSINLNSPGSVPVAILTTTDFDASTVNPTTVTFANAPPIRWEMKDVDHDGDTDMLLHFNTQDLNLDKNSREATLTGKTDDEMDIVVGTDSVNIVPKGRRNSLVSHNRHCRGRVTNGPGFFGHTSFRKH